MNINELSFCCKELTKDIKYLSYKGKLTQAEEKRRNLLIEKRENMNKMWWKEMLRNSIGYGLIVGVFVSIINFFVVLVWKLASSNPSVGILLSATFLTFLMFFIPVFVISLLVYTISRYFLE